MGVTPNPYPLAVGLFTAYLAYRYGKRRAARRAEEASYGYDREVCDLCGFERRFHADDEVESCPE